MKKVVLVLFCVLISGCVYDPPSAHIEVENCTDSAIYVYYSFCDSLELSKPLYLFEENKHGGLSKYSSPNYRINAYSIGGIGTLGQSSLFKKNRNEKIRLFFIKEKIMRDFSWEEIVKKHLYEEKLTLTEKELMKNDWMIVYDPRK